MYQTASRITVRNYQYKNVLVVSVHGLELVFLCILGAETMRRVFATSDTHIPTCCHRPDPACNGDSYTCHELCTSCLQSLKHNSNS